MERTSNGRTIRLVQGDITRYPADAIVNAANSALVPGGGVCGAIHRAGGPDIARECAAIGHCDTGDAVATTAGRLPARHVIHAVAPIWRGGTFGEDDLLSSAYRRSLEVADEIGDRTIAFPSLGAGIYGYPVERAAPLVLKTIADYLEGETGIEEVTMVLFTDEDRQVFRRAMETMDLT
ncbi:MAG TPA: macro domain-containing protein [Chloroflexota bacterium]|nr:macro domain-containing protein [Chloroflexota bacterium]